jgi:hypothetical protein
MAKIPNSQKKYSWKEKIIRIDATYGVGGPSAPDPTGTPETLRFGTFNVHGLRPRAHMLPETTSKDGVDALWVCETFYADGVELPRGDPLAFRTVAPRDMRERAPRPREAPKLPNGMVLAARPGRT